MEFQNKNREIAAKPFKLKQTFKFLYRAALLTSLYPVSTGIWPGVFYPEDLGGLSNPTMVNFNEEYIFK